MSRQLLRPLVALVLLVVVLNASVFACGPFSVEAIFVHSVHPNYPLDRFAQGQIGVVQSDYARSYLYVAYRYLSGATFTPAEQKELVSLWKERLGEANGSEGDGSESAWREARKQIPNLAEVKSIEVYRMREKPNDYDSFLNCPEDAFGTAAAALKAKIAKYGAQDTNVKTWVEAQDVVFSNCSQGKNIPTALESTADAGFRAERNYQIAAANFYATSFDDALKGFEGIANDSKSPWQTSAPYLIARAYLRKASLGPDDSKSATLAQAESQFKKVLADRKLSSFHESAQRLLNLVRFKLHPTERRAELAKSLSSKQPNKNLRQELWDYTYLLDGVVNTNAEEKVVIPTAETDDLTDWIFTLQSEQPEAIERALTRWQATKSQQWLVASLAKVDGSNPKVAELIDQALAVSPKSAAYVSARFHAVRLLTSTGKTTQARGVADEMLKQSQLDQSSLNLFSRQRMTLANNLNEFLQSAARVPAALSWNDDGREVPSAEADLSDETKKLSGRKLFDTDAATVINKQLPLTVLREAAASNSLPAELQRDLVQAVWLRAVLLGDYKTADELVPLLKTQVPSITGLLTEFTSSTQPEAKQFAALFAWLKVPGMEPVVDVGVGRTIPLNEQDSYRDNWWCNYGADFKPGTPPTFLTAAQLATAKRESTALNSLGAGPNYLCKQVIQWTNKNPNDPRNAEALHLAILSTRYGCGDKETGKWSKTAFDLLHRKYPTSSWAKKTPYWFKGE